MNAIQPNLFDGESVSDEAVSSAPIAPCGTEPDFMRSCVDWVRRNYKSHLSATDTVYFSHHWRGFAEVSRKDSRLTTYRSFEATLPERAFEIVAAQMLGLPTPEVD